MGGGGAPQEAPHITTNPTPQEDPQEEFGWKLVHGDVFRPPRKGMMLSVLVGSGVQVCLMVAFTMG